MDKKLICFLSFFLILTLTLNLVPVSASYSFGYWGDYRDTERVDKYKDTTEYKRTTESTVKAYWGTEKIKTTASTKTEISRTIRTPSYNYYRYPKSYKSYRSYPSYSGWRYKEPYNYYRYDDYYYKPRYDYSSGYHNWRW